MLEQNYIYKTQQIVAYISLIIGLIVAVINSVVPIEFNPHRSFNIVTVLLITMLLSITYFFDKPGARLCQSLFYVVVGIVTIIVDKNFAIVGDIVLIIGISLLYQYQFLKKFGILHTAIMMATMFFINYIGKYTLALYSLIENTVISVFSTLLIAFQVLFLHNRLDAYIKAARLHHALYRLALSSVSTLYDLNFRQALARFQQILTIPFLDREPEAFAKLEVIRDIIEDKDRIRKELLQAVESNHTIGLVRHDISRTINSCITLNTIEPEIAGRIKVLSQIDDDLFVRAAPYEMYFLFQNIISSIIEEQAVLVPPQTISIFCKKEKSNINVTIMASGPKKKNKALIKNSIFYLDTLELEDLKDLRLKFSKELIRYYEGSMDISNPEEGGIQIILKIPEYVSKEYDFESLKKDLDSLII